MGAVSARNEIIGKIAQGLKRKTSLPFPGVFPGNIFHNTGDDLCSQFENEFSRLLGRLIVCNNMDDVAEKISELAGLNGWNDVYITPKMQVLLPGSHRWSCMNRETPLNAEVAVTDCECLVARTGTVVVSSALEAGRTIPVYAPVHVTIAYEDQLVADILDAIKFLKKKYPVRLPSSISFASGPSRTGDIEKTLVVGVHGPGQVYVLLVKKPNDSDTNTRTAG